VFKPTEVKSYQQIAFCDITGRESRLPLKIRGDGIGPKLALSFDSIDIGEVFASSVHTYEVSEIIRIKLIAVHILFLQCSILFADIFHHIFFPFVFILMLPTF